MAELQDISPDQLKDIVQQHGKWLESDGKEGERADLTKANLQEADLRRAQLLTIRNWKAIRSMSLANIHGLEIPPEGFLAWAVDTMNAVSTRTGEEWTTMKAKAKEKMET